MATFLFDSTVFGPVQSRRLGVSLGINLLPNDRKLCSFNCIYCECGWNPDSTASKPLLPTVDEVKRLLEEKLIQMGHEGVLPDVITFAGNGEPTMHPGFAQIIDDTLELRNKYAPMARVAVLSNSTMLHKNSVVEALKKVDDTILKLDSGMDSTISLLNLPNVAVRLPKLVEQMKKFAGKLIVQTMFIKGQFNGQDFDNTQPDELEKWMALLAEIAPQKVMIYTIARDTPAQTIKKVTKRELESIARLVTSTLQIPVDVSA